MLERYRGGDYRAVYDELCAAAHAGAGAIAAEMARRVRANLDVLAERWRKEGSRLPSPVGEVGSCDEAIMWLEQAFGPLPPLLRAFYRELGWIDFVEDPDWYRDGDRYDFNDSAWPTEEELDPLQLIDPRSAVDDALADPEGRLHVFDDPLAKLGESPGPVYVLLTARETFDPVLHFDGEPLRNDDAPLRFGAYLRESMLERGGLGIAADELDPALVERLTRGLTPW